MVINLGSPHRFIDKEGTIFSPKISHLNANQTDYLKIIGQGQSKLLALFLSHLDFTLY